MAGRSGTLSPNLACQPQRTQARLAEPALDSAACRQAQLPLGKRGLLGPTQLRLTRTGRPDRSRRHLPPKIRNIAEQADAEQEKVPMPTYDYVCDACDYQFELFQSISDGPKRKCPKCGRLKLRRLIGPGAAILFKGSGFYCTDYRSDSYKKAAREAQKAEKGASSTTGGKEKKNKSGTKA